MKITHLDTHEELRFDSNGKRSESCMDNGTMTPLSGYVPSPGRKATNGSTLPRPPGVSHTMNFYPVQTRSYGHPSSTFYQSPKISVPPQRCNSVKSIARENCFHCDGCYHTMCFVTKIPETGVKNEQIPQWLESSHAQLGKGYTVIGFAEDVNVVLAIDFFGKDIGCQKSMG